MPPLKPLKDLRNGIRFMIYNPRSALIWGPILLAFDSALLKLIIWKVPYTEIDYKAYMEQIALIQGGETNYAKIYGGTGPLVYPGGHVLLFRFMNWLTEGTNCIQRGQHFFRYLYLITLSLQLVLYYRLQLPGWCIVLASLSKRLHSIYVLRLFNDCFTTFFIVLTALLLQVASSSTSNRWLTHLASLTYSMALSVKMNALLYLPGITVGIFYLQDGNFLQCLMCAISALSLQYAVAMPFLPNRSAYLDRAFDFHRKFLYHWTINWHFLDEETFNSDSFHLTLLASHFTVILSFLFLLYPHWPSQLYRACRFQRINILIPEDSSSSAASAIVPLIVTTNFAGILFARSLHYQFLSWYHWTLPLLLRYSGLPFPLGVLWYIVHEWCWNSYPPNYAASIMLTSLNAFLLTNCWITLNVSIRRYKMHNDTCQEESRPFPRESKNFKKSVEKSQES